jgi:hypothetical protein
MRDERHADEALREEPGMPDRPTSIRLPAPSEQRAQVFRLASPEASQQTILARAQRLGLRGDLNVGTLHQDARRMTYAERTFELTLHHASGGLRFHDTARWQVDDGEAHVTFDDATAVRLAQQHIEELALVPLAESRLLRVTRLHTGVVEVDSGVAEERVVDVGVAFQRVIDDIPVSGAGGKVIVYIDHNGSMTGVDCLWREIEDVYQPDVELRSSRSVQEELERYLGEEGGGLTTIEDVRLSYLELDWDERQNYLQPAYFLPLTIVADGGPSAGRPVLRSEHFVPAVVTPPEPLIPPPAVRQPSPRDEEA